MPLDATIGVPVAIALSELMFATGNGAKLADITPQFAICG
ncbi:hypothetical protein GGR34_003749 [Microvirga flocculans]|uniref:Uncharacterized protein n=1 Tax=Microvirga flocculans TaxID=217168 RepID=A0A7W6IIE2_9HYPH|nr:hypothetical protein [Microvirga flocculans]